VNQNRRELDRESRREPPVNRLQFPEAAHFEFAEEPAFDATSTINTAMEAVADVSAGNSVVVSSGLGGGLLLLRRGRKQAV